MTLKELKKAVLSRAPGLADYVGEETLIRYFNECQRLLSYDSRAITSKETDVTDGVFSLPDDCLVLKYIAWDSAELTPWPNSVPPKKRVGYPMYYFQTGTGIELIPAPAEGLSSKVKVYYIARPPELQDDTDEPSLADCADVLVAFALWQVYRDMGELDEAAVWQKIYHDLRVEWVLNEAGRNYSASRVRMVLKF